MNGTFPMSLSPKGVFLPWLCALEGELIRTVSWGRGVTEEADGLVRSASGPRGCRTVTLRTHFDLDHHEIPAYLINFPDLGIVQNSTFLHQKKEDSGAHIWGEVIDYAESDSAMIRVMFLLICM